MADLDERERLRRRSTANHARRLPVLALATAEVADCFGFVSASQRAGWIDRWLVASAVVHGLEVVRKTSALRASSTTSRGPISGGDPPISLCPTA